jgi:hypothetical protein
VQFQGQWYLFYHDKQLSPNFDKNRSVRIDSLHFNDNGTIQRVIPTLRGVGIVDAKSKIQIDRYSDASPDGASVSFLNPTNTFEGWKISLNGTNAWVRFDRVDFAKGKLKSVSARAASANGGEIQIRVDSANGPLLATVKVTKGSDWTLVKSKMSKVPAGIHDLIVTQVGSEPVDLDWISFE